MKEHKNYTTIIPLYHELYAKSLVKALDDDNNQSEESWIEIQTTSKIRIFSQSHMADLSTITQDITRNNLPVLREVLEYTICSTDSHFIDAWKAKFDVNSKEISKKTW